MALLGVGMKFRFAGGEFNSEIDLSARSTRGLGCRSPHGSDDRDGRRMQRLAFPFLMLFLVPLAGATSHSDLTVDQLKAKVSSANVSDKVHICVQIAEKQLDAADKLYAAGEVDQAQPALTDVVAFSELALDYSIQSRKHQKQTEISIRAMARKLTDILHLLAHEDQAPVQDAISRLDRVRDDLLTSMFPKGVK